MKGHDPKNQPCRDTPFSSEIPGSATVIQQVVFFFIVFYPVDRHEEENSGSAPCSSSSSADLQFIDAASQTDDRNYRLETIAMKQKHDKEIRKISRDSRAIRIRYGKQSN